MEIQLFRIDSRLLHGQITTNWAHVLKINRIFVVSDNVSHDEIRKALIHQASPVGIRTNIIPIQQMIYLNKNKLLDNLRVIILVESPQDALRLILGGIRVYTINIGSLSFDSSKQMISDSVAVNTSDINALKWIHNHNIKLEIRKVSNDNPKDIWKILCNKKLV